jgi:phosphopantothenoylcysteine decarboxylase/phosphopantothenate--cysteine ligase
VFTTGGLVSKAEYYAHINLSREASAILIAPIGADFMAKLLHGALLMTC